MVRWSGGPLIDGLTAESTMAQARALLGEPEAFGEGYLRYRVAERFLHLAFGETDQLADLTLMTRVP